MTAYQLEINGVAVTAYYPEEDIRKVYLPLLEEWSALQKEKGRRIIVFIAAPAGCGKSTLAAFLAQLAQNHGIAGVQALGMDGFHCPQKVLDAHTAVLEGKEVPLAQIKGHPLTFDVPKLQAALEALKHNDIAWPYYSRQIHDPIENAIPVTGSIILLEGNYLLYEEEPWDRLSEYCDASLFLRMDEEVLLNRIIERKIRTGRSEEEAVRTVYGSDRRNIQLVLNHSRTADHEIVLSPGNQIISVRSAAKPGRQGV